MLHLAPGVTIDYAGPAAGPVASSQGCRVVAGCGYEDLVEPDIVLVPGGGGTRKLVDDVRFLGRLAEIGRRARLVVSVCTGSALLAAAGLLDGRRATSNKRSSRSAVRPPGADTEARAPRARRRSRGRARAPPAPAGARSPPRIRPAGRGRARGAQGDKFLRLHRPGRVLRSFPSAASLHPLLRSFFSYSGG